jgi:hypothetical protein
MDRFQRSIGVEEELDTMEHDLDWRETGNHEKIQGVRAAKLPQFVNY